MCIPVICSHPRLNSFDNHIVRFFILNHRYAFPFYAGLLYFYKIWALLLYKHTGISFFTFIDFWWLRAAYFIWHIWVLQINDSEFSYLYYICFIFKLQKEPQDPFALLSLFQCDYFSSLPFAKLCHALYLSQGAGIANNAVAVLNLDHTCSFVYFSLR